MSGIPSPSESSSKPLHGQDSPRSSVMAILPDRAAAERLVILLHERGFSMKDLSIVGKELRGYEEPEASTGATGYAEVGAGTGAWIGGLAGLLFGAAFLIIPGIGPLVIAGPISAAILGGFEGAVAGAAIGGLGGALVGWGVPHDEAVEYEAQVKAGKFLVVVRGTEPVIEHARQWIETQDHEGMVVYKPNETA